ncbi:discoidin domain-containing protein [Jiangella alkaliphila]|uniref:CARDB protein n=1 Tax=Jiangella alkaliphila TaxID=419479 RepID=A0A1H2K0R1_9ACTN|nr:discoidin domain-containing protein [Jiangella alkaliphila]SDU61956.1 CARDB protein [Jiangella alkaliphila]
MSPSRSPSSRLSRTGRRLLARVAAVAVLAAAVLPVQAAVDAPTAAADHVNLAAGRPMSASGHTQTYVAGNAGDGNQGTYWESPNNAFPQWLQVDLGAALAVQRLVVKLPTAGWGARTQTIEVQGSTDGSSFSTIVAPAPVSFAPAAANTATITFAPATTRYVRLRFTANTGWPAGQVSELEVYGPAHGDTQAPTAPSGLAFTQPTTGEIRLTWAAATDNVGVTAYDVYANGELLTSVGGTVLAYTDVRPPDQTVTYHVRARDAAGNQSPNSNSVTRTGQGGDTQAPSAPTGLAFTQPTSGQIRLTWSASTDNVGVTGYEVHANGALLTTVSGSTLAYTDTRPATQTVTYQVRARDAAGNVSAPSNSVTRTGSGAGSNLAVGKPIEASSTVHVFAAANANDNDVTTYWEGAPGAYPSTLTVRLGSNAVVDQLVVRLNPDPVWGPRTQTLSVLGREQSASTFTTLRASAAYAFSSSTGNTVTIPVGATVADVRLQFTANTGAPNGQVAELQVIGTPAPNPDLVVTDLAWTPASPVETDAITVSATVRNAGSLAAPATSADLFLGDTAVGTVAVGALAAGASTTVSTSIGTRDAGSYQVRAEVDPDGTIIEQDDANNAYTDPSPLVVAAVATSDLVPVVSWTPDNPAAGSTVSFSAVIRNQGTVASAGGAHGLTLTVRNAETGAVVRTLTGSHTGVIAAGGTTAPVALGTWPAANGRYTVTVQAAVDGNELPVKQGNNTVSESLFVGRGANLPFSILEAEDGRTGGGAQVLGPNRTIGDIAGEASGRRAVRLNSAGSYVEFTTAASTNTLVTRFSIPDAPGGGGTTATLNVYVNGQLLTPITLTSRYAWLYGNEASPGNSPGAGGPRHIYDEANILLGTTVPAGSTIRLQKDAANTAAYYAIDFISLEQATPIANPDPARYVQPNGFTHQDVQSALDRFRMDTTGQLLGVYLPAGDYQTAQKFQVYGKPVQVLGAGPWFTRFHAPAGQENTDVGFRAEASVNGSRFSGFAYFGNYTSRIDGPGKVFDFQNVSNITIDNIWAEHMICLYWGANTDNMTITDSRARNLFADALNMTNGSSNNRVANIESRASGDDSFALFAATDAGGGAQTGNVYENLTSILTWRAAGVAVYGGVGNTFRNLYIADTLVYSGITISSLDFGIPMDGFGASPPTRFENISIVRAGGHFWGAQTFPGIWIFSASKVFQGIRVTDVDIVDPTYSGIMFQTNYVGGQPQNPVADTVFTDVTITGARRSGDQFDAKSGFGIWVNELPEPGQGPAVGSAVFENLVMSNNAQDVKNTTSTFQLVFD